MIALIGGVIDLVNTWLSARKEKASAKSRLKLAEINNKAKHIENSENRIHEWDMASMLNKDKLLRRVTLCIFSAPFVVAIWWPTVVHDYFASIEGSIPQWWVTMFVTMVGTVWGLHASKNALLAIINALNERKKIKLERPFK